MANALPTVPEYFQRFINDKVDLIAEPKQCCPFHGEKTPSFSYDLRSGRWSCFGACHAHGDVIDMHMRYYKLKDRAEALASLKHLYNINTVDNIDTNSMMIIDENLISLNSSYVEAVNLARTPERWLELDYVMSKYPVNVYDLNSLLAEWKGDKL